MQLLSFQYSCQLLHFQPLTCMLERSTCAHKACALVLSSPFVLSNLMDIRHKATARVRQQASKTDLQEDFAQQASTDQPVVSVHLHGPM